MAISTTAVLRMDGVNLCGFMVYVDAMALQIQGNKGLAYLLQRRGWGLLLLAWQTHECPGFVQVDLA